MDATAPTTIYEEFEKLDKIFCREQSWKPGNRPENYFIFALWVGR